MPKVITNRPYLSDKLNDMFLEAFQFKMMKFKLEEKLNN
jgi:hypothetical protein